MTSQPFDPAIQGELDDSPMTRQEGTTVFKGNVARRAAWERRQAIVSNPAFRKGQDDPLHDPIWGELRRGSLEPVEHGRDFFHDVVTGAKDLVTGVVDDYKAMQEASWRNLGQIAEQVGERLSGHIRPFRAGQHDPLHDPIWGELRRGGLQPVEHAPDALHQIGGGAAAAFTGAMRLIGTSALMEAETHQARGSETRDDLQRLGDFAEWRAPPFRPSRTPPPEVEYVDPLEPPDPTSELGLQISALGYIAGGLGPFGSQERKDPGAVLTAMAEHHKDFRASSAAFTEATQRVDAFGTATDLSTAPVRRLRGDAAELAEQFVGFNAVVDATPTHLADANASFAVTARERLPELIGQVGTLESQTLAAVDAFSQLAAAPRAPAGRAGRGTSRTQDHPLAHDPRYSPREGESWEDYYYIAYNLAKHGGTEREKALGRERATIAALTLGRQLPQFASGTAFAPGGVALVGELGPELVNLPRGSQVIPNPRLGGDVHVHVNVEGSVVAERDLAQRLRQELIRTSRRTVDLGFN